MKLEIVTDLNESSQYRTRQSLRGIDARTIVDHAFLDTVALWILYNEFDFSPSAIAYANKTMSYSNFNHYRQSGTDMYMTYHIISTSDSSLLSGTAADSTLLDRIRFPEQKIKIFLNAMKNNNLAKSVAAQTLYDMEHKLHIDNSNYRSIRRLAAGWQTASKSDKSLVITRLLQFYRMHARRGEIFSMISSLAKSNHLELDSAKNAEISNTTKAAVAATAAIAGYKAGRSFGKWLLNK